MATTAVLVHDLVRNMTAVEKSHFKKTYAAYRGQSKRLALFDWLNRQSQLDADELNRFCQQQQIHPGTALQALRQTMLRSLRLYHTKRSRNLQLNELLAEIEILYQKGLFELASQAIEKGIALADRENRSSYALQFRNWRMRCAFAENAQRLDLSQIEEQIHRVEFFCEEQRQTLTINHLAYLTDATLHNPDLSTAQLRKILRKRILGHPFIQKPAEFTTTAARYAYHDLVASTYFYLEHWDQCLIHTEELYRLLQQSAPPYRLAMLITNLMTICNLTGDSNRFGALDLEFEAVASREQEAKDSQLIELVCRPRANLQRLRQDLVQGNYEAGHARAGSVLSDYLQTLHGSAKPAAALSLAHFYFSFGKWQEAAGYCHDARMLDGLRDEPEAEYLISWIELLSYYFLRDDRLFHSRLRSTAAQFREGKGRHYPSERTLLGALRRSFGTSRRDQLEAMRQAFRKVQPDLDLLRWPAREFDLVGWWEKQISES